MKFYKADRQKGKTTTCVEWLRKHPKSWLLVINEMERDRIIVGYNIPEEDFDRIVTPRTIAHQMRGRADVESVAIDNLDIILSYFFRLQGIPIDLITWNDK